MTYYIATYRYHGADTYTDETAGYYHTPEELRNRINQIPGCTVTNIQTANPFAELFHQLETT